MAAVEDVDDLDEPDAPGPSPASDRSAGRRDPSDLPGPRTGRAGESRWPDGAPAWLRGPVALVALVVLAGAAGATAGSFHRAAVDAETALAQSLAVGFAYVGDQSSRPGATRAEVTVSLLNHGSEPVAVRVQGLDVAHQGTAEVPDEVRLEAGATAPASFAVDIDCDGLTDDAERALFDDADAATADDPRGRTPTRLLASVRPDGAAGDGGGGGSGRAVDVQLPVLDDVSASLLDQMTWACGSGLVSAPETGWLWLEDGTLRVTVANPVTARSPVRLSVEASSGLGESADPSLPRDLAPGDSVVVDLRVAPDCDVVGDGSDSWLELQAREPQGATYALSQSSSFTSTVTGTAQWLARQVALACG